MIDRLPLAKAGVVIGKRGPQFMHLFFVLSALQ